MGPGQRRAAGALHHLAVPPHGGVLCGVAPAGGHRHGLSAHRPDDRPDVLGQQGALAAGADPRRLARAEAGEICIGTVDAWLLWNLSGGGRTPATSPTPRGRSSITCRRSPGIRSCWRCSASPRSAARGAPLQRRLRRDRRAGWDPGGLPIGALIGDSHAALFGHAGFAPGVIKATYGTGSSLMTPTARRGYTPRTASRRASPGDTSR